MKRQFHINLFINSRGHHEASWRHPRSTPRPLTDVRYYIDCAQKAEAAHFDSIFLADVLNIPEDIDRSARVWLEPLTTLGALAVTTSRIGLIATASTTYTEPFNLARQFASLDHASGGRASCSTPEIHEPSARQIPCQARSSHKSARHRRQQTMWRQVSI